MAAGLGFKTFNTGEVLTSADVNGYLMQGVLVFASEAARNAAITSPQEGQFAYTKDNNSLWYYTGSAWAASGATGDIEGVTAGTGISGGGTSGTVTITNSMATAIDAKGDLIVGTGADTFARLAVGTNGHTLVADSSVSPTGLKWAVDPVADVVTTAGDLLYGTAADTVTRLGIGTAGQVLQVNSGATAPEWATAASGSTFAGCSLTKSTGQSVATATTVILTFDTEEFDSDAYHSTSSNTSRITIPSGKGGKYLFVLTANFATDNASGQRLLMLYKNGAVHKYSTSLGATSGFSWRATTSIIVSAVATDYFEFAVYQDSGVSLNINSGAADTTFATTYLGA